MGKQGRKANTALSTGTGAFALVSTLHSYRRGLTLTVHCSLIQIEGRSKFTERVDDINQIKH